MGVLGGEGGMSSFKRDYNRNECIFTRFYYKVCDYWCGSQQICMYICGANGPGSLLFHNDGNKRSTANARTFPCTLIQIMYR